MQLLWPREGFRARDLIILEYDLGKNIESAAVFFQFFPSLFKMSSLLYSLAFPSVDINIMMMPIFVD